MQKASPKRNHLKQRYSLIQRKGLIWLKLSIAYQFCIRIKISQTWHPNPWTEIRSNCQMPILLVKNGFILDSCYFEPRARALNWLKLCKIHRCSSEFSIDLNDQKLHMNSIWTNFISCSTYMQTHRIKTLSCLEYWLVNLTYQNYFLPSGRTLSNKSIKRQRC